MTSSINSLWDVPSEVTNGFATVGIRVRFPNGQVVPMGVPAGTTGREYAAIIGEQTGYTVTAVIWTDERGIGHTADAGM